MSTIPKGENVGANSNASQREVAGGLAGLGRFGKLHASVLSRMPGVRLAAVCDPLEHEVMAVADRYGAPGRFTDYNQMLDETELDAVFVVTPEPMHGEMALRAIERGRAVFVEKPLATSFEEGKQVADAAARAGVLLQVGLILRFDVQHALLRQQVAGDAFGQLVSIRTKRNVTKSWFPPIGDRAHPVYETSIHDLDLLVWYAGSPCTKVYAVQRSLSGLTFPDSCFALVQFANGVVGIVETSWFVPDGAPANILTETWHGTIDAELEIVGTEQTGRLNMLDSGLALWSQDLTKRPETNLWPEHQGRIAGALQAEDTHFIECLRSGATSDVASVADAVAGLQIADAIIASAESGREIDLQYDPDS